MSDRQFDFPLGLRPWPNPLRLRRPLLKPGFTLEPLENSGDAYRLNAIIPAGKVFDFVLEFARSIPDEAFFILEFYENCGQLPIHDDQVPTAYYSPYLPIPEILASLEPYLARLIHDGFVGFGLANNRVGVEMFYSEEKVLTCFTDNHLRLTDLFARHGLPHREHLPLPSDFGHDHLSLLCHHRGRLPEPFASMPDKELDFLVFCRELVEQLEMYPVEETLSFFLSRKEQEQIATRLAERPDFLEFIDEEDFGVLLFDWNDFVSECEAGFDGDLIDYQIGLKLRDVLEFVAEGMSIELQQKLREITADADERFRQLLTDQRKRFDPPTDIAMRADRFWCHGIIAKPGASLRRDLIRAGWFKP